MQCDALVVGGGPAGSTCARLLSRAGWNVVVVDRAAFPRDKVCAGWLTPAVFPLLELTPDEYRATGLTIQEITGFRTGALGGRTVRTQYSKVVSYAIRRCEFDDFLLRRANVRTIECTDVTSLRRGGSGWIVNDTIDARIVIGAGGHFCPVARHLRGGGPDATAPVVAQEAEFPLDGRQSDVEPDVPALFFCRDLEGYGWCVRKGNHVNVGIGRRSKIDFNGHVRTFAAFLERSGVLADASSLRWKGHAYLAEGAGTRTVVDDGVMLIGDAAGLAYPESGEGIKPAIESGRLAATMLIGAGGRVDRAALMPYANELARRYPPARHSPRRLRGAVNAVGRALLGSSVFSRHVVLDRWFLRAR